MPDLVTWVNILAIASYFLYLVPHSYLRFPFATFVYGALKTMRVLRFLRWSRGGAITQVIGDPWASLAWSLHGRSARW